MSTPNFIANSSKDKQLEIAGKVAKSVERLLSKPKLKDLTDQQLDQLSKGILYDSLKKELEKEVKKSKIGIKKRNLISSFINTLATTVVDA